MNQKKQYEASYAGYVYEKPVTYWTPTEEVKNRLTKVDLSGSESIEAGGVPIIVDGNTAYVDAADGHTVIEAVSGMKKSICAFMPLIYTLAKANENMILTDPKGELYDRTAGFLKSRGYKVYCLDFRTMDKDFYNVLYYPAITYRSGDKDKGLAMLSDMINALAEDQRHRAKDPFWPDTAAMWMNATGSIMLDAYPEIDQINILNWSDYNVRESAQIVERYLLPKIPDGLSKSALKQCCTSAENTFRSILITASSFLTMFNQNPKLATMLSHSTFTLQDLLEPKTAVFFVTDDTTSTTDNILGMIISQMQTFLVDHAYHSPKGKLQTRTNFLLDEFASIPIPNMDKALATHRSRNIRYYLCVQSLALMKKRYDNPEALLSNCAATLFLGSTELELLQQMETKLGMTDITPDGRKQPLCSQAELMTLEKAWAYKEAIFLNLSENIRYCTMLPSIEAYDLGNHPAPSYSTTLPEVPIYSVSNFTTDVLNKEIRAPFSSSLQKRTSASRKYGRQEGTPSMKDTKAESCTKFEVMDEFKAIFDTLDDEDDE